jgi:outer membrane protein OmpA-like peptidoglycan-associated protein
MKRIALATTILTTTIAALGCGPGRPPPELVDARAVYARARRGPAPEADPVGLAEAKRSLEAAERAQADHAGSEEAKNLAYIAQRKALLAETNARTAIAEAQEQQAIALVERVERQRLGRRREDASSAERRDADRKARAGALDALEALSAIAAVREGPRGERVVTLSGASLFETKKAALMPAGRQRLDQVARVLRAVDGRRVQVVAYADDAGDEASDEALARRRAGAVRDYLVSRDVRPETLRAEGHGPDEAVATDEGDGGRAEKRRVEIVVEARDVE